MLADLAWQRPCEHTERLQRQDRTSDQVPVGDPLCGESGDRLRTLDPAFSQPPLYPQYELHQLPPTSLQRVLQPAPWHAVVQEWSCIPRFEAIAIVA